jgi:hypothetical protein
LKYAFYFCRVQMCAWVLLVRCKFSIASSAVVERQATMYITYMILPASLPDAGRRHRSRDPASLSMLICASSTTTAPAIHTVELARLLSPANSLFLSDDSVTRPPASHLRLSDWPTWGSSAASSPPNHRTPCWWMGIVRRSATLTRHIPGV